MKPTNFAKYLTEFLVFYLPRQKNVSNNTIRSYRDTFKLLINYCQEIKNIAVEQITLEELSKNLLIDFLEWLETNRKCCIATRNQRLAGIHSFFKYVQGEEPAGIFNYQQIAAIPIKKAKKTLVEYLTPEAMKILLNQPNKQTSKGRRDLTLLSLLYDSGVRVQELIDLRVCDLILQDPATVIITGKGNKVRRVPITKNTVLLVQRYLLEQGLDKPGKDEYPLFFNNQRHKLTKEGVAYILSKYVTAARNMSTLVPAKINVHMLRHTKAMHLLQAGVNLIYTNGKQVFRDAVQ